MNQISSHDTAEGDLKSSPWKRGESLARQEFQETRFASRSRFGASRKEITRPHRRLRSKIPARWRYRNRVEGIFIYLVLWGYGPWSRAD